MPDPNAAAPTAGLAMLGLNLQTIDSMAAADLDLLPFGAIQLDTHGRIKNYNTYESNLSHLPRSAVIGKDFFHEVAPCTDVKEFRGRFQEGVEKGFLHAKFNYHFAFSQNPRDVSVTLFYSDLTKSVWVFVQPRSEADMLDRRGA